MSDNKPMISDEAVEAALEVSLRQLGLWGKELPEDLVEARRTQLRELLEAAAPYIAADAWEEGHAAGRADEWSLEPNPYRSQA